MRLEDRKWNMDQEETATVSQIISLMSNTRHVWNFIDMSSKLTKLTYRKIILYIYIHRTARLGRRNRGRPTRNHKKSLLER